MSFTLEELQTLARFDSEKRSKPITTMHELESEFMRAVLNSLYFFTLDNPTDILLDPERVEARVRHALQTDPVFAHTIKHIVMNCIQIAERWKPHG